MLSLKHLFTHTKRRNRPAPKHEKVALKKTSFLASVNWDIARIKIVAALFMTLWGILWCRAWYVQMIEGPRLARQATRQHMTTELVSGRRGDIYDRNGLALARSVECRSVYVKPGEVTDPEGTSAFLAQTLNLPLDHVRRQVSDPVRRFVWVARKIDDSRAENIRKAALSGVGLSKEYERFYPFKQLAGQLLGFVGVDDKGLEGLERSMEEHLGGQSSRQLVQRDATGRRFYFRTEGQDDPAGKPLALTLDVQVQFFVEEALERVVNEYKAKWAGCLIVDVPSGDILAWGQYPFFNPNAYRDYTPIQHRNRLAQDALEPGSTLKPFVVAAAMQEKIVNRDTLFKCEGGKWETKTITIRDTKGYDELPVHKIIRYSSNIGAAKVGLALGSRKYHQYLSQLGFGGHSTLPLAESKGILRQPRDWSEADIISTAFGQSISVTGVQMAQAYLTLVNGGVHKSMRIVLDAANQPSTPPRRIFHERISREVLAMMRDVVEEDGTGKKARIDGVQVGGKTGTAQKADRRSGTYGTARMASFVGVAPIDKPRYLVLVIVDEPANNQYGGIVAAPVFQDVISRTMAYQGHFPDVSFAMGPPKPSEFAQQEKWQAAAEKTPGKTKNAKGLMPSGKTELRQAASPKTPYADNQVPDVVGKSVRMAVEAFASRGIVPVIRGEGQKVVRQSPEAGTHWPANQEKTECVLWLSTL
ncbi:MAG: PASTA domain-containing protein [Deltaproteobacteria bacterium]|jgi:cell division protein FtsI (penicillin-binding protein 3)|nr:PASTA domain-containing protein [Deltaproteobacteria bacterium]